MNPSTDPPRTYTGALYLIAYVLVHQTGHREGYSLPLVWICIPDHTIQITLLPCILTSHPPHDLEPYPLIYLDIWLLSRTLQVAFPPVPVGLISNSLHQLPSQSPSLPIWIHHNNIAKVVSIWIRPDLVLRLGLAAFPDLVATVFETAAADVSDVQEALFEP